MPCKWYPLTAMENAAKDGFSSGPGTTVIPVKCTGLIKVSFLLKLFAGGIEGILILGCLEEDCRYFNGSKRCGEIVEEAQQILELAGISKTRLGFRSIGESQGREFRKAITSFAKQLKQAPGKGKRVTASGGK